MNETPTNSANEELLKPSASFLGIYNLWIHQVTWNLVRRMLFFIVLSIQQSGYFWNGQANMQHCPNFIRVQLFQKMIWPCRIKKFLQTFLCLHLLLISTLLQTLPSTILIVIVKLIFIHRTWCGSWNWKYKPEPPPEKSLLYSL